MKILILYDSYFGNTEKIARSIGDIMNTSENVEIQHISQIQPSHLSGIQLLIVGSPTRAFSPTVPVKRFLKNLRKDNLHGIQVAAFDTRISTDDSNSRILNIFMNLLGYAAEPLARKLIKKGGIEIISSEGFIVENTEGPLLKGELKRAADWANRILKKLQTSNQVNH